ncbi:hypothetical protein [Streptomyces eurythermus]|uniref:hypothetical protein n=1 Tax=Streptomyces eurythermus TaxID=42237 RepID=UPI003F4D09AB
MTHIPGKRFPRPGAVLAAVTALVATFGPGLAGEAKAAAPRAATPAKTAGPFDDDRPHGFASLAGATAELVQRGSVLRHTSGRTDEHGTAFGPHAFHDYRPDPAAAVPALVKRFSGPQQRTGTHNGHVGAASTRKGDPATTAPAPPSPPAGRS